MWLESHASRSGTFSPAEFEAVQAIFKEICSAPWFDRSAEQQAQFAAFLLRSYTNGLTDPERLREFAIDVAKAKYGWPMDSDKSAEIDLGNPSAQNADISEPENRPSNSAMR